MQQAQKPQDPPSHNEATKRGALECKRPPLQILECLCPEWLSPQSSDPKAWHFFGLDYDYLSSLFLANPTKPTVSVTPLSAQYSQSTLGSIFHHVSGRPETEIKRPN